MYILTKSIRHPSMFDHPFSPNVLPAAIAGKAWTVATPCFQKKNADTQ